MANRTEFAAFADTLSFYREQGADERSSAEPSLWSQVATKLGGQGGSSRTIGAPVPSDVESQGLLHKSVSSVTGGARAAYDRIAAPVERQRAFITGPRIVYCAALGGAGILFISLAFLVLPTVVFAPQKFASLFTFGSLFLVAALAVMQGLAPLAAHFTQWSRLPYTITYLLSLVLTLVATMYAKSYILTVIFASLQVFSLFTLLVSYIPGGTTTFSWIGSKVMGFIGF